MKIVIFDDLVFRDQASYRVAGLELCFYEHADQALDVLRAENPDLVMMDYSMSAARHGDDAVALIRADPRFATLPIVGISADRLANERLLDAGASDAVPKTHLRGYLRRLLDQQRLAYHLR